ncbi:MAG: ATP-binding protein [Bacteroidota bacterium]|nr:ATP-binding protein [Bacteroidota bacterium]
MKDILSDLSLTHWPAILLSAVPCLLNIFIFIYVRIKFPSDKISKVFSFYLIALMSFQLSNTFMRMSNTVETATMWSSIFMFGVLFMTPLGLHFTLFFTGLKKQADSFAFQILLYGPGALLLILMLLDKDASQFYPSDFWGWVYNDSGSITGKLIGYLAGSQGIIMLGLLLAHIVKSTAGSIKRKQTILIATGYSIPLVLAICTEVIIPFSTGQESIPLSSAFMTCFSVSILIALRKLGLFSVSSLQTETILQAMKDMIIIISPDKKIQYVNKQGEITLGIKDVDKNEQNVVDFFAGKSEEAAKIEEQLILPVLEGEKSVSYATEFISKGGRTIPVLISATSFRVSIGKPLILLLIHDRTELIQAEQQLAIHEEELKDKTEELNTFFYRTTHDLKGPVASIIGLANIAKKEPDQAMLVKCMGNIETSALRLNNILLDFIKVMQIKEKVTEVGLINFYKITDNIIQAIKYSTERDIVGFKVFIEPNIIFHSDETLIDSILYNLIINGVNYRKLHGEEDPYVFVQVRNFGNGVIIKVIDNGIGMKKDIHSKIFNLFYRGNEYSKGTGLGLYILKNATNKLHGHVQVESESNEGTTFTVYLPDLKSAMITEEIPETLALNAAC